MKLGILGSLSCVLQIAGVVNHKLGKRFFRVIFDEISGLMEIIYLNASRKPDL